MGRCQWGNYEIRRIGDRVIAFRFRVELEHQVLDTDCVLSMMPLSVLAREPLHPFSLAYALMLATECHWLRREAQVTREQAEATLAVATTKR